MKKYFKKFLEMIFAAMTMFSTVCHADMVIEPDNIKKEAAKTSDISYLIIALIVVVIAVAAVVVLSKTKEKK